MSKTFDLSSVVYPVQNGTIKVVAIDSTGVYSDSNPASLSELYPSAIVPTPTAEQVTVSGKTMTIDTSSTGAEKNKVTLSNDEAEGSKEFPVSQTSVDLSTIKQADDTDLPAGDYSVSVQGEKNGEAASVAFSAGSYTKEAVNKILCFTANTAGSTIKLVECGFPEKSHSFSYSTDKSTWTTLTPGTTVTLSSEGDKIYVKGSNAGGVGESINTYYKFSMTGSISASGNVSSLLDGTGDRLWAGSYCFYNLFASCTALTTAPDLIATSLYQYCYANMFLGCTSLTRAPELPALSVPEGGY